MQSPSYLTRIEAVEVMRLILLDTQGRCNTLLRSNEGDFSPTSRTGRQSPSRDKLYVLVQYEETALAYYATPGRYQKERLEQFVVQHVYKNGEKHVVARGPNILLGRVALCTVSVEPEVQEVVLRGGDGRIVECRPVVKMRK